MNKKQLKKLEKREMNKKDKEWREKIKTRDKNKCVICNKKEYLDCHHLFPRELKKFRWVVWNGILLCKKHHKFSKEISPHKNPFVFYVWMMKNRKEQFDKLLKEELKNG